MPHGLQPVRDHHHGLAPGQLLDGGLQLVLVLRVHVRRSLVQQHDGRVLQQRSRDGDALLLAARHRRPALAQHRGVALRQRLDEVVAARGPRRGHHLLVRGIGTAELDVVLNGVVEQVDVLEHHGEVRHELVELPVAHVLAAQRHRARVHVPEAGHKVHERGLARPGRPDERRHLPRLDGPPAARTRGSRRSPSAGTRTATSSRPGRTRWTPRWPPPRTGAAPPAGRWCRECSSSPA